MARSLSPGGLRKASLSPLALSLFLSLSLTSRKEEARMARSLPLLSLTERKEEGKIGQSSL